MKIGKVFTKGQLAVFFMVLALGCAVWLNVKYSGNDKFMGQATYVNNSKTSTSAVKTSAKVSEEDYFVTARNERDNAYEKTAEEIKDILKSANISESEKSTALNQIKVLSNRIATAQNIESLLAAKGFKKSVAIIGDSSINVVVKGENLSAAQTLQIQDIVTSNTDFKLSNIKIVAVK